MCEDDPSEYLQKMAREDQRIVYKHFGVPEADWSIGLKRNLACHYASGPVIAHFDDDDMYGASYLEDMVKYMADPSLAFQLAAAIILLLLIIIMIMIMILMIMIIIIIIILILITIVILLSLLLGLVLVLLVVLLVLLLLLLSLGIIDDKQKLPRPSSTSAPTTSSAR